jgi:SAM-dependent methyltransferase
MNIKIYQKILLDTQGDISQITANYIKETFDINCNQQFTSMEEYVQYIDNQCLDAYFSKIWQPDMKKWKYSGLKLIDEVNALNPRSVLDVGCGYNEFKGKIKNLTGIDPYNDRADYKISIMDFRANEKFDVILCLGSVNFGSQDKITAEIAKTVHLLEEGGTIFFRVNPGVSHTQPESRWIEFFAWNVPFIIELAEKFNLKVLDIRDDANQRKYFVYRKI